MKPKSFWVRGLGPFHEEVRVDLDAIPGKFIAVVGRNGAGKSTLLEAGLAGPLYRECPTRGALKDLVVEDEGVAGMTVELSGGVFTVEQRITASGKARTLITDARGMLVVESAMVTDADEWLRTRIPHREVLFASLFAKQASGGFLDLKPAARKSVMLQMLGLERMEALAERARAEVKARTGDLAGKEQAVAILDANRDDPDEVRAEIRRADETLAAAQEEERLATEALDAAEREAESARKTNEANRALRDEIARRAAVAEQTRGEVTRAERDLAALADVVRNAEAIRIAKASLDAAERLLLRLDGLADKARDRLAGLRKRAAAARQKARDARKAADDARTAVESARASKVMQETTATLVATLPAEERALETLRAAREAAAAKVTEWDERVRLAASDRITGLRGGLEAVSRAETLPSAKAMAADTIKADDEARAGAKATGERAALRAEEQGLKAKADEQEKKVRGLMGMRATLRIEELEREIARGVDLTAVKTQEAYAEDADAERLEKRVASRDARLRRLGDLGDQQSKMATGARPLASMMDDLTRAEAKSAHLARTMEDARARLAEAESNRDGLASPGSDVPVPETATLRRRKDAAISTVSGERARRDGLAGRLERAEKTHAARSTARAEVEALRHAIDDAKVLAEALGKDGIQALEIDAAGPELTAVINTLLHGSYGTRYSVKMETTRPSGDGKKTVEVFDVGVTDSENGYEGTVEGFSGGQKGIVGEALMLGLTTLQTKRSGLRDMTLVRDESGAALDEDASVRWVEMMRRAVDMVGARRVLVVTHNPMIKELADSRIVVGDDGRVSVE